MPKRSVARQSLAPAAPFAILLDNGPLLTAECRVDQWLTVPDHPRQRYTQRHAKASHWTLAKRARGAILKHLSHVSAACLDGQYYKLDGHTRAYLWEQGELPTPPKLHVTIYRVDSREELDELYTTFDAQSAAESNYDKVYGAYREAGLTLRSKRLRNGFIVDALNIALRGVTRSHQDKRALQPLDIYQAVTVFKDELVLLDSVDPQPEIFYSGVVAAALISLSLEPRAVAFYERISRREGNKRQGRMDPVEAVLTYVERVRQEHSSWLNAQQEDVCARTLRAFLAWQDGEGKSTYWFKTKIRAAEIAPLVAQMKALKGIADDPRL